MVKQSGNYADSTTIPTNFGTEMRMKRIIQVRVIPNSDAEGVEEGNPVVVKVREPPEGGRANLALVKLLSKHFNARARIISGFSSKRKLVEISR